MDGGFSVRRSVVNITCILERENVEMTWTWTLICTRDTFCEPHYSVVLFNEVNVISFIRLQFTERRYKLPDYYSDIPSRSVIPKWRE